MESELPPLTLACLSGSGQKSWRQTLRICFRTPVPPQLGTSNGGANFPTFCLSQTIDIFSTTNFVPLLIVCFFPASLVARSLMVYHFALRKREMLDVSKNSWTRSSLNFLSLYCCLSPFPSFRGELPRMRYRFLSTGLSQKGASEPISPEDDRRICPIAIYQANQSLIRGQDQRCLPTRVKIRRWLDSFLYANIRSDDIRICIPYIKAARRCHGSTKSVSRLYPATKAVLRPAYECFVWDVLIVRFEDESVFRTRLVLRLSPPLHMRAFEHLA